MERVVTVNLGGNAYALEEAGYAALSAYLDAAARTLAANPDKAEIIKDLEAAIADRLLGRLHHHKTVVTAAEMTETLAAMGPVDGAEASPQSSEASQDARAESSGAEETRKRLFRLREGAVFAGVCTGIAAYTRLDVALVRIGIVVAALFAPFIVLIAYVAAMFVIPSANTAEEWNAAHGLPATAQQIIGEARRRFDEMSDKPFWRRWTEGVREPRRSPEAQRFSTPSAPPATLGVRIGAGFLAVVMAVLGAAAVLGLLYVMTSLVLTDTVLGFSPALDAPLWMILLLVALVFAAFALPLQTLRQSAFQTMADVGPAQARAIDTLVSFGLVAFGAWLAWMSSPLVQALWSDLLWAIRD
ncbi:MAG: PspC domain-containing protein [Alphaproteobacteria bacterium]|nr:PspC domain-containing protein [Alphaproteobacteria bacterium]